MAATQALPVPASSLSDEQRIQRRRSVESALGTTLAEGVSPGPEAIALAERYVAGEISLQDLGIAVRSMSGI